MAAYAAIFLYKNPVYLQQYTGFYAEHQSMTKQSQNKTIIPMWLLRPVPDERDEIHGGRGFHVELDH